jgi:hypothetical protein
MESNEIAIEISGRENELPGESKIHFKKKENVKSYEECENIPDQV